jgi:hypothetical protein
MALMIEINKIHNKCKYRMMKMKKMKKRNYKRMKKMMKKKNKF